MKKKITLTLLVLVCALCCALGLVACNNGDDPENNDSLNTDLEFSLTTDGNYAVAARDGLAIDSNVVQITIPSTYSGKPVTEIKKDAFKGCRNLTSVTIPDSITKIGDSAFSSCTSLTSITIPNSVTSIGTAVFQTCTSLTSVTIPDSVTKIGGSLFADCTGLTSVTIPNSITEIGNAAFRSCTSLTNVTIPNSVTEIGNNAFSSCTSLASIIIPNSITSIGTAVFHTCTSLTSVTIGNGVTSIDGFVFYKCSALTSITIPNSVTSIGEDVFYDCNSLTSVTVGNGVTSIGNRAFHSCTSLTNVTIPDSVTEIGNGVFTNCTNLTSVTIGNGVTSIGGDMTFYFYGCSSLESISVGENNKAYASQDGILYNKAKTEFIHIPKAIKGAITIPDSITEIGANAFEGRTALESITIPDGVTEIGNWAFNGCDNLTEFKVSVSILKYLKIGTDAQRIKNIKSLVLTCNGEIEEGLLNGFGKLESLTLPFIGKKATNNVLDRTNVLGYIFGTAEYEGGVQTKQIYSKTSTTFIDQWEMYYIPESLKSVTVLGGEISYGAFSHCSNIESVILPEDLTTIETRAFEYCSSLKSIVIPDSVETIGTSAFAYCIALKTVIIGNGVNTISSWAFQNSGVETLVINKVGTIEQGAFADCYYLETVYYAKSSEIWENVNISTQSNSYLTDATLYCSGEWEYVDGVPTVKA